MANIHEMLWLVDIKIAYDVFISRPFETTLCSRKAPRTKKILGKFGDFSVKVHFEFCGKGFRTSESIPTESYTNFRCMPTFL